MNDTQTILNAIESLNQKVGTRFDSLENEIESIKNDIRSINLTIENEISHSISIIAEGHTDLNRKLDESLKVNQQKEMLLLRVAHLENEVRILRERIEGIA